MFKGPGYAIAAIMIGVLACTPAPSVSPAASESAPRPGGTLRIRNTADPSDWDLSYTGKDTRGGYGMGFAYSTLIGYKAGPDIGYNDQVVVPQLAERWEVSPDGRDFTFHIRNGVKFANLPPVNGRQLTAADAKWSFEYWSRTGWAKDANLGTGQYDWMFEGVDRIDAADPQTLAVHFKQPAVPFLSYVAADHNPVVPHEIYDREGNLKSTIAGSGPYQLDLAATQPGSRWVWKKNSDYWETGKPYIAEVHSIIVSDDSAAYSAFQTKQLDVLGGGGTNIRIAVARDIEKANPGVVKYELESAFPQDFFMRVDRAPLNDTRLRRAIALSVDRQEFMRVFQEGRGSLQAPGVYLGYFSQDEIKQMQPYDPEGAKRLLAEAGFPNGTDFEFTYPGNLYGEDYLSQMQLLQAQLKKTGINLVFKSIDPQAYISNRREGNFAINVLSGADAKWDIDFPLTKFHAAAKSNYYGVKDPELTRLIEAQRAEVDAGKRRELVRQAGRMIVERAYGVGMYSPVGYYFWHPYLKNYAPNWNITTWPIVNSWLEK